MAPQPQAVAIEPSTAAGALFSDQTPLSSLQLHRPSMIDGALIAALLTVPLYALFATSIVSGADVSFDSLFLAAALAAILACALIYVFHECRQPGLKGPRDAEARLNLPVTMMAPAVLHRGEFDREELVALPLRAPLSNYASAFRAWVQQRPAQSTTLAICSSLSAEGKTTFAISLARTAALEGQRVALIDCDGRMRAASVALEVNNGQPGLVQVLDGSVALEDALLPDSISELRILGYSESTQVVDLSGISRTKGLSQIIATLSETFDLVIIDTPPLLALAEAGGIAGLANEVILVSRWRRTPLAAIRLALRMLSQRGIRPKLALTFVRFPRPRIRLVPQGALTG